MTNLEYYWNPVDQFLLDIWKKNESFAMCSPRIQTPYDLIRWNTVNDEEKYGILLGMRRYYQYFLQLSTLMNIQDFKDNTKLDFKKNKSDSSTAVPPPFVDDYMLISHTPVLAHWLGKSGFLMDKDINSSKEYDNIEYMKIFNSSSKNKTKRPLYPSFMGFYGKQYLTEIKVGPPICESNDHIKSFVFENKDDNLNKCDNVVIKNYFFKSPGFEDLCKKRPPIQIEKNYDLFIDEKDEKYVLNVFDDPSYDNSIGRGFLNSDILSAYNMNFDINSQYSLIYHELIFPGIEKGKLKTYVKISRNNNKSFSKFYNYFNDTFNSEKIYTPGPGIVTLFNVDGDEYEVFQGEFYKSKYAENDIDMINLFETKEIDKVILDKTVLDKNEIDKYKDKCEKKYAIDYNTIDNYLKKYKVYPDNRNYKSSKDSCFESFEDYYNYLNDTLTIEEISNAPLKNYFWFMYGALPTNNIMYEDLRIGLRNTSFIHNKPSNINITLENSLPTEQYKDLITRGYKAAIKFIGLVFNITDDFVANLYYTNENGYQHDIVKYNLLKRVYPKITGHGENVHVSKFKRDDFDPKYEITDYDRSRASEIMQKIKRKIDISKDDLDFLYGKKLMNTRSSIAYDKIRTLPDIDNSSSEYKDTIGNLDEEIINSYIKKKKLSVYKEISQEAKDITSDIEKLSKVYKFSNAHASAASRIINGLKNGKLEIIPMNFLYFLASVKILKVDDILKVSHLSINDKHVDNKKDDYLINVNQYNNDFKHIFDKFDIFDYENPSSYDTDIAEIKGYNDKQPEKKKDDKSDNNTSTTNTQSSIDADKFKKIKDDIYNFINLLETDQDKRNKIKNDLKINEFTIGNYKQKSNEIITKIQNKINGLSDGQLKTDLKKKLDDIKKIKSEIDEKVKQESAASTSQTSSSTTQRPRNRNRNRNRN